MRNAVSLLEVLVVTAIVAVVAALTLPAIQMAREASRRMQCSTQLRQIGVGVHHYEATHGAFPPGASTTGKSFLFAILPQVEQQALFERVESQNRSIWDLPKELKNSPVRIYKCPSDSVAQRNP